MSLEEALKANTEAVLALTAVLKGAKLVGGSVSSDGSQTTKVEVPATPPKADKPKAEKKEEKKPEAAPAVVHPPYDDVRAAVNALAKVDKAKAVEIIKSFGVEKAQDAKPEQYADLIARLKAAMLAPAEEELA